MYNYNTWQRFYQRLWLPQLLNYKTYTGIWNYFTDIHPKTERQFNSQKFLAGGIPFYGSWMQSRSEDERNNHTRGQYSLAWSDIQYPWLSGVTSGNAAQVLGSGTWQFSKNVSRLYR